MSRTKVLQEVRKMRFEELYEKRQKGRLTMAEAAEVLGIDERTFRRWSRRYETGGAEGLVDQRIGKASWRRAPLDEVNEMLALFETQYMDFTVKHFHEKLCALHGSERSYMWTKNKLQEAGKVTKAKKRGPHRKKRPRRPMTGMMLHQDGSTHAWVDGEKWDLIVTLDDASSEVYSGFFVEEEGTVSSFQGVQEVIAQHGLFSSLYTDRGSHYWHTPEVGGKVDKENPTQFHRALKQLGIELIAAYSPEARGRSERVFRTLQDRLPKELRLAGITDKMAANRYLNKIYWPQHNRQFAVKAKEEGNAFVPWFGTGIQLADILCVQEERVVGKDNTVRYCTKILQIPPDKHRHHYVKAKVRVHEYGDKTLAIFHGPRCLARYDAAGIWQKEKEVKQVAA